MIRSSIMMLAVLGFFGILETGCAHGIGDAVKYADKAMAIVDVTATKGAEAYQRATAAVVVKCRADVGMESTPEQREACLKKYGFSPAQIDEVIAGFEQLSEAYDAIAHALELIRQAQPLLERAEASVKAVE